MATNDPFPGRCQCHGECGKVFHRRRACADPDLEGRCRAQHGERHPRTLAISEVRPDPRNGSAFCKDCWDAFTIPPGRPEPVQSYSLFDEGLS